MVTLDHSVANHLTSTFAVARGQAKIASEGISVTINLGEIETGFSHQHSGTFLGEDGSSPNEVNHFLGGTFTPAGQFDLVGLNSQDNFLLNELYLLVIHLKQPELLGQQVAKALIKVGQVE